MSDSQNPLRRTSSQSGAWSPLLKDLKRHPAGFLIRHSVPKGLEEYYKDSYFQTNQGNYGESYSVEELDLKQKVIRRQIAHALDLVPMRGKEFLDVGCGEGFTMAEALALGWNARGIDFSLAGAQKMNPTVVSRIIQGEILSTLNELSSTGSKFDLIWLGNVLEHLPDPVELMVRLRELATAQTVLVVEVPNDGSIYQDSLLSTGRVYGPWWVEGQDHISFFDYDGLRNIGNHTGWHCLDIQANRPVDFFLSNKHSNYVQNPELGREAHLSTMFLENHIESFPTAPVNEFYSGMASVGLGRSIIGFFRKTGEEN